MFSRIQVPVNASENLPIPYVSEVLIQAEEDVLLGSSMRRIVPETQAVLRGRTNSKPSLDMRVT